MNTEFQDKEIDLSELTKKVKNFLDSIVESIIVFILFVKKKIVIITILFIIGFFAAFFLDEKTYTHEVSVIPNFGSNEYLYKKVEQIDIKLRENDSVFFKELGISPFKKLISLKIQAYPAIYNFINNADQENNFELIKLLSEDGDLDKIIKDELTSKNYYHHKITVETEGMFKKEEIISPILNYLNSNSYFENQQQIYQKNVQEKIKLNDSIISQIDHLIVLLSTNNSSGTITISEKNSIPELVEMKNNLISEKQKLLINESVFDKIIKEESSIINIRSYKPLFLNNKIVFPVALILLYFLFYLSLNFYKKRISKRNLV